MELTSLLERMKMEHLLAQLDGVCEQAAKGDVDDKGFLTQALEAEWRGRHQRGVESRLKLARFPWLKTPRAIRLRLPALGRPEDAPRAGRPQLRRARRRTSSSSARPSQRHNAHLAMCVILQGSAAPSPEFVEALRPV